jgi:hypothetical protein
MVHAMNGPEVRFALVPAYAVPVNVELLDRVWRGGKEGRRLIPLASFNTPRVCVLCLAPSRLLTVVGYDSSYRSFSRHV